MANRIYLAGIVERGGRILLIRQTPKSQWELPGGPLLQRHPDADLALGEIMLTFGITFPDPEERFIETVYLPDGEGHVVYNIYATSDWEGEPEIPIGMAASWYELGELDDADMREEVRNSILVTFGLREPVDTSVEVLKALSPALESPGGPMQPPLAPLPTEPSASRPAAADSSVAPTPPGEIPAESVIEFARPTTPEAVLEAQRSEPAADDDTEMVGPVPHEPEGDGVEDDLDGGSPAEARMLQFPGARAPQESSEPDEDANQQSETDAETATFSITATETTDTPPPAAIEETAADAATEPDVVIDATRAPAASRESAAVASARREKGLDVLRTLNRADPAVGYERLKAQYQELADDVVDFALGDVWNEPTLDRKQRSLVVVSMLAALGGKPGPLRSHINGALNHGASPDEVVQVMRMVAVYAGFPAALEAWGIMEEVFRTRRVAPEGRSS